MHVSYKLDTSPLHGIGLFAGEDISKGKIVYTASPILDVNISQEQFDSLNEKERQEVRWWGFFDEPNKKWHVDFDMSRVVNHSYSSTITQDPQHSEAYLIAARDIKKGEELTQNYLEFETAEDLKKRGVPPR